MVNHHQTWLQNLGCNHENMAAYIDIKSWSTLLQVTEKPLTVIRCTTMVQLCLNHE